MITQIEKQNIKVGYARRTSAKNKDDQISIEAQIKRLKEKGYNEVIQEIGKTASMSKEQISMQLLNNKFIVEFNLSSRPEFLKLLHKAKAKEINEIGFWKWDRCSRNTAFLLLIYDYFNERLGVKLTTTDDSNEELMVGILSVLSKEEAHKTSTRINFAKQLKFDKGLYIGTQRKLGYKWENIIIDNKKYKTLIPKESERQMILDIRSKKNYKEICKKYHINPKTYYSIKKDFFYDGYITYNGKTKRGIHTIICSD